MGLRTLVCDGVEWTVWDVIPTLGTRVRIPLNNGTDEGWLCFQSAQEKRRIAPIPAGWETLSDEELLRKLRRARVVVPHEARSHPGEAKSSATLRAEVRESMRRARGLSERVREAMNPELGKSAEGMDGGPREPEAG